MSIHIFENCTMNSSIRSCKIHICSQFAKSYRIHLDRGEAIRFFNWNGLLEFCLPSCRHSSFLSNGSDMALSDSKIEISCRNKLIGSVLSEKPLTWAAVGAVS